MNETNEKDDACFRSQAPCTNMSHALISDFKIDVFYIFHLPFDILNGV